MADIISGNPDSRLSVALIALDIDGTLKDNESRVPEENLRAIEEARALGIRVALCSGRILESTLHEARLLGLPQSVVAGNGARVFHEGREIFRSPLPSGVAAFLAKAAHEAGAHMLATTEGVIHTTRVFANPNRTSGWSDETSAAGVRVEMHETPEALMNAVSGLETFTWAVFNAPRETLDAMRARLEARGDCEVHPSGEDNIEIMAMGANKGEGLRLLAKAMGIPALRVMAVGDNRNDLPMLRWAGVSVAMGNAPESVKAQATHVTESNDGAGVAFAIRRWALAPNA